MTGLVIVFDIDGTLLNHRDASDRGLNHFLRRIGAEPTPLLHEAWLQAEKNYFTAWREGQMSFAEQRRRRVADLLEALGRPVAHSGDLDRLFEIYLLEYENAWRTYPDVIPCLGALRAEGFEMAVLTNGDEGQQNLKLERIGVRGYFSSVLTSDTLGAAKPHREAFDRAAEALGCRSAELVYVGDDLKLDAFAARSAGWGALHPDRFGGGCAKGCVSSLREVPGFLGV